MATKRRRGSGSWEFIVKRKGLLPKPISLTFNSEEEGDDYCRKLEKLLDAGVIPSEFRDDGQSYHTIGDLIVGYLAKKVVAPSDRKNLGVVNARIGSTPLTKVNYPWVEQWVTAMKHEKVLAPSTIRHHVGALARCFDWACRLGVTALAQNPLRLLEKGYATYNDEDVRVVRAQKKTPKGDTHRDRRLEDGEEDRIRAILSGEKPENRERPLALNYQAALECLFELALESCMRMREIYTLSASQVDLAKKTVFLDKTKNGDKRQVPLTTVAIRVLKSYMKHVEKGTGGMQGFTFSKDLLFPWWDGEKRKLDAVTSRLSSQFDRLFEAAGCEDLHFHDLRHEAVSRLFERTTLNEIEASKISGHKDPRQLRRYSNLRGSNLAGKLW
jgi:integrase